MLSFECLFLIYLSMRVHMSVVRFEGFAECSGLNTQVNVLKNRNLLHSRKHILSDEWRAPPRVLARRFH